MNSLFFHWSSFTTTSKFIQNPMNHLVYKDTFCCSAWKYITNIYVPTFIKIINLLIECYDFLGFILDLKIVLLIIKLHDVLNIEPRYISMNHKLIMFWKIISWMKNKAHGVNNLITTNNHSLRSISTFIKWFFFQKINSLFNFEITFFPSFIIILWYKQWKYWECSLW
jgi:hypothetical protein